MRVAEIQFIIHNIRIRYELLMPFNLIRLHNMNITKKNLLNYSLEELKDIAKELGDKAFRGEQIFEALHKRNVDEISDIKAIGVPLQEKLAEHYFIGKDKNQLVTNSAADKTQKFLFEIEVISLWLFRFN